MQFLDAGGATLTSYPWMLVADTGAAKDGWFDENAWDLADVSIAKGDSVLINTKNAQVIVKMAGEVANQAITKTSVAGFNWSGNVTPVSINIQDIQLTGANVDSTGADNMQFLDAGGATLTSYPWMLVADTGAAKDGWFDENAWDLADVSIDEGQGVLINTKNAGVVINVKSAL